MRRLLNLTTAPEWAKLENWLVSLPFLFALFLGKLLQVSNGEYRLDFLLLLIGAWSLNVFWVFRASAKGSRPHDAFATQLVAIGLCYFAIELALRPQVHFNEVRPMYKAIKALTILGAFCAAGLVGHVFRKPKPRRAFWILTGVAATCWMICRVLTVAGSPRPFIDCFTSNKAAVEYFISGLNPYGQKYVDIYNGYYDYPAVFTYWPGVLYPQTVMHWLFGDIRYAFVLADGVTAFALARLLRQFRAPLALQALLPLSWLAFPVGLHVLEMSWTDTLLISVGSLVALNLARHRWLWAGAWLGYFCSIKQYGALFALLVAVVVIYQAGVKVAAKSAAICLAVFALIVGPFAIHDFKAFYDSTIGLLVHIGIRKDALSIPAALIRTQDYFIAGQWMSLSYLTFLALAIFLLARWKGTFRAWAGSLVLLYGGVFLMGKQAFCNYYFMLGFFSILAFVGCWENGQTSKNPTPSS